MKSIIAILFLLMSSWCFAEPTPAAAAGPTTMPSADHPVVFWSESRSIPPMSLYFVKADLTDPNVHVRVSPGGPDPDGAGPWQTTLMIPSEVAAREHFDFCVNASFFSAESTKDAEGVKSGYVEGKRASAVGAAMTDGKLWSAIGQNIYGALFWIDGAGKGHLTPAKDGLSKDAKQAVQGVAFVLQNGNVVQFGNGMMNQRHPRTVVGLDADGKTLTLLTVDGRNPFHSIGMTGTELGQEMKNVGCTDAVNMDGGGSTELVMRDANGKLQVVNHPSDLRERAVADTIGISVDGTKRAEEKK